MALVDLLVDFGSGTIHTTVPQPEAQGATVHLYESASVVPSALSLMSLATLAVLLHWQYLASPAVMPIFKLLWP